MNNLKKNDKLFHRKHGLIWFPVFNILDTFFFYVNTLRFLGNRSENTFRRDLNFEEITYLSSLFMAFLASVLVFPCRRSNLIKWNNDLKKL